MLCRWRRLLYIAGNSEWIRDDNYLSLSTDGDHNDCRVIYWYVYISHCFRIKLWAYGYKHTYNSDRQVNYIAIRCCARYCRCTLLIFSFGIASEPVEATTLAETYMSRVCLCCCTLTIFSFGGGLLQSLWRPSRLPRHLGQVNSIAISCEPMETNIFRCLFPWAIFSFGVASELMETNLHTAVIVSLSGRLFLSLLRSIYLQVFVSVVVLWQSFHLIVIAGVAFELMETNLPTAVTGSVPGTLYLNKLWAYGD